MCDSSDPAIKDAYQNIRATNSDTTWCVLGYEGNSKVVLQNSGSGGINELADNFKEDEAQYGYLKVISGDAESKRTKFVFICWVGEGVGPLKRAKVSVHKADVKKVLKDFAVEVHATTKAELEEGEIMSRVKKAGGADYSGNTSTN